MPHVDEDPWITKCPRCGDTNQNVQCPVSLGTPPQCAECTVNPWKGKSGYDLILYYICMKCGTRYLTPKLEREEIEYHLFSDDG